MSTDFKSFPSIPRLERINPILTITQKLHGTNACIHRDGDKLRAGSRNRWLTVEKDNYGFAKWVEDNTSMLLEVLPLAGTFYGEWCGPGINSGEGLTERTFVPFDLEIVEIAEGAPSPGLRNLPVLYSGPWSEQAIMLAEFDLKRHGSALVPGYMHVEGMVLKFLGQRIKVVFDPAETGWSHAKALPGPKAERVADERVAAYIQPERLEKLMSRDERYAAPEGRGALIGAYLTDAEVPDELRSAVSREIFKLAKGILG